MNENADLIFGVDTSEAVGNLNRLSKALQGVYDQMGKGSANPSRALAKNTEEMGAAARTAQVEFDALARKANEAARVMVSSSRKIGDAHANIRSEATSSAEAIKKWERALEEAANNPETAAGYERQKRQIKDLADYNSRMQRNMTDAWHKEINRRNRVAQQKDQELLGYSRAVQDNMSNIYARELHRRSEHARKEGEKQLAYQKALEANMSSLVATEMKRRAVYAKNIHDNMTRAYVGELRRREQAAREHEATMRRIENEKIAFLTQSSKSQLRTLETINMLRNQGISDSALTGYYGGYATGQSRNNTTIAELQRVVDAQRKVSEAERALNNDRQKGARAVATYTNAQLAGNKAMHDARGLARGLSGALGQLWLTYGSLGPLVAGAAMGAIARQTYEIGKDVEYRLAMVEALGNRAIRIQEMMPAVHGSMKTPLEAAQGLQELAQAGLNAEQSLMALTTVLNLATLGEMSVGDAALTTTAALSTFNLEVGEAIRVGNVYAKTASISNTNVQGIAEAMKQAGSAAAIYGVEIEAVAGQIAILAQNGIRGSAAGTAVRNAMTELHAPTQKAQGIMKELGIEIYNSDKTSRDYIEVLGDLRNTYYSLNEESRAAMLRGMFNERSRRFIQIAIKDYDQLKEVIDRVTYSQGFLMEANLKLLDTVEGASNRMQSVLQQSMVEAFDLAKPQIMSAIQNMEQLFASDEFKRGVTTLAKAVADLTSFMSEHASTILKVGAAYVGWKLAIRPMIPAMAALAGPLKNITEYATKFGQVMGVLPLTISKTTPVVTTTAAATTTLWSRIVSITGAVVRFLGPMGLVAGTLLTASTMMNRYRTATEGAAPAQDTLQDRVARATKALNMQNTELRENLKLRKLAAEGSTPEIHDTNLLIGESEAKMGQIVSDIAFRNKQVATLEKVLEDHRTGAKSLSDAALTTLEQSVASSRREIATLGKQLEVISKDYAGLKGSLTESAEVNLLNYNFDVLEGMKRTLQEATFMANSLPENTAVQSAVEGIRYLTEEFERSGGSADDFKASVDALYNTIQQNLGSWTPTDDKSDPAARRMERDLERYDVWLRKQLEAIKTSDLLTQAYLAGEEQVRQYTLAQEIANVQIADRTKHEKQIAEVLKQKNLAETRMNVAKQVADLGKQTKTAEGYAKVLLAQSKGYAQGEAALKKFNKEQALNNLLTEIAPENMEELTEVLERFSEAYDKAFQQDEKNEKLRELNGLVEQTKNSTQLYREQLEHLQKLKPFAEAPEQVEALSQAIHNLHIENDVFLQGLNQLFDGMDKSFGNMWQSMLSEGKFTLKSLSDTFKNTLAEMAHAALTRPILISFQNAMMGTNLAGGWGDVWGGGSGGAMGSLGGLGGLGGVGSLFTNFGGSMAGAMQSLGGSIASLGGPLGDMGANLIMNADTIGSALDFAGTALSYGNSILSLTKGNYGAAAGGAIGTYFGGPVGSFLGSRLGGMLDGAFKGETRSGGRWSYDKNSSQARFYEGPSGGYGGQATTAAMTGVMGSAVSTIDDLFRMVGANAAVSSYRSMFESSGKGRGGTFSGGTLAIEGKNVSFGTNVKGTGYGGKSGSAEEMFENMTKDMVYSTLEAWKLASAELPRTISAMLDGVNIRSTSVEQAEALAQTIISVTSEITSLTHAMFHMPLENFREVTFDLAYVMTQVSGGVDNLTQNLSSFYDKFTSETEKHQHSLNSLELEIRSLNLELPSTREGFRELVDSLGQVNSENAQTIASLLKLSNLADTYYREEERLAEQRHQEEVRRQDELRQAQEQAYRDAQAYTDKLMNEFRNLAQEQIRELESVSKATDDIAQALSRALNDQITSIQSLTTSLETTIRSLRSSAGVGGMQAQQGWDLINRVIRSGELPSESDLNAAITAIQQSFGSGGYMSAFERDRDQLLLANKLEEINDIAGPQLSIAEQQLKVMEDQLAELRDGTKRAITLANLSQAQINAIREVDEKTAASVGLSASQVEALRDSNRYAEVLQNLTRDQLTGILGVKGETVNLNGLTQKQMDELKNNTGVSKVISSLTDSQIKKLTEIDTKTAQSLKLTNNQYEALKTGNKDLLKISGLSSNQLTSLLGIKGHIDEDVGLSKGQILALEEVYSSNKSIADLTNDLEKAVEAEKHAKTQITIINKQLEAMNKQYDQLRGLNATMKTLDEGMRLLAKAMKAQEAAKPKPVTPTPTPTPTPAPTQPATPKYGDKDYKFRSATEAEGYIRASPDLVAAFAQEVVSGRYKDTDYLKYAQYHYTASGWNEKRPSGTPKRLNRQYTPQTLEQAHKYVAGYDTLFAAYIRRAQTDPTYRGEAGLLRYAQWHWDTHGAKEGRRFAKGGYHTGGLRLVGEYGPELEVTGPGRIHNVHRTQQMLDSLQPGSNKSLDESGQLAVLTQEVRNLREDNNRVIRAMIEMQHRNVRMLERWETDGLPETRVWEIDSEQFRGGGL